MLKKKFGTAKYQELAERNFSMNVPEKFRSTKDRKISKIVSKPFYKNQDLKTNYNC